jgi:hypothetical protein
MQEPVLTPEALLHRANGIILIYDIASERSFQSVSSWLQEVNRYLGHKSDVRKLLIGTLLLLLPLNVRCPPLRARVRA